MRSMFLEKANWMFAEDMRTYGWADEEMNCMIGWLTGQEDGRYRAGNTNARLAAAMLMAQVVAESA